MAMVMTTSVCMCVSDSKVSSKHLCVRVSVRVQLQLIVGIYASMCVWDFFFAGQLSAVLDAG